jgi:hypothetical protein
VTTDARHPADEDLLTFHWDGGRATGAHLATCAGCSARLDELRAVLSAAGSAPVPERGESYGREVWARIAPRLPEQPGGSLLDRFADLLTPRALVLAGGLASVAAAAFLVGRLGAPSVPPPPSASSALPAPAPDVAAHGDTDRILYADLASHLDRSEAVLLELVHGSGPGSAEQERLADLLPANRLYRQSAGQSGQRAVSGLLEEIERVLLEVEHGPAQLTDSERDALRRRIDSEGILFRLRVLSARVRELERNSAPPTSPRERKRA